MLVTVNFQWEQGGYLGSWYHSVLGLVWLNGSNGGAYYPVLSPFTYKLPLRSFAPGDHLSDVLGWTIIRQPCSHCIFFFYSWQSFFFQSNPNIYWRSVILPFSFLWVSVTLCCVPLILFFVCALFPYISFLPCCPKWALHFSFLNISFIDNALVYFSPPNRRYNTNLYLGVSVVFSLKPTFLFLPLITYHLFSETAD